MNKKIITILFCCLSLASLLNFKCDSFVYATESNCKSFMLIEANSGTMLYGNNIDEKLPVASIVKLMTLQLTFDALDKGLIQENDMMQVSDYATSMGGSQLFLDANTKHQVCDLIKSVVIASANDSAVVLAENISGSEKNFVIKMNDRAKELNLQNTHYVDCTGLNEEGFSTARDVATLSRSVLTNPRYQKYSQIWLDSYTHPSGRVTKLANTNKLLRSFDACVAGKTGTTDCAGYCYTSLAKNNGFDLITVILGADDTKERFILAKEIFLTGYANYQYKLIYAKDGEYADVKIKNAKNKQVKTYLDKDLGIVMQKGQELEFKENLVFNDNLIAPLKANSIVGRLELINNNNEIIATANIFVKEDVIEANYYDVIKSIIEKW